MASALAQVCNVMCTGIESQPKLIVILQIATLPSQQEKEAAYNVAIDKCCERQDASSLLHIVTSLLEEATPAAVARACLLHLVDAMENLPNEAAEQVAAHAVERLRGRLGSPAGTALEEADFKCRYLLYRIHMGDEDWLRAGAVLSAARLDSAAVPLDDETRAAMHVKVAQVYLRGDDDVAADRAVRKAGELISKASSWAITAQYKACYASVLDAKRKFLDAAIRYAELATSEEAIANVDKQELVQFLQKAAICAVLAPAGPQRQRFMAGLYRDERSVNMDPIVYSIFEKMYLERIVSPVDAARFESSSLQVHQKAKTSDGSTIFARALVEHNMLAVSKVYSSISMASLAGILGIDASKAEKVAAKMINEGRLRARMDQVDSMLDFSTVAATGKAGTAAVAVDETAAALSQWDGSIKELCTSLNATVESIRRDHPQLVPEGRL